MEAQSSGSDTSASEDEGFFEDEEASEESPSIEDEDDFDVDAEPDAARVAQWVDEEELDETPDEDEDESDSADGRHIDGARLVRLSLFLSDNGHSFGPLCSNRKQTCIRYPSAFFVKRRKLFRKPKQRQTQKTMGTMPMR